MKKVGPYLRLCTLLVATLVFAKIVQGSAQCHWNGETQSGHCNCDEGFKGSNCNTDCGCQGHGKCKNDNTCACEPGWKWSSSTRKCVYDCSCSQCIGPNECACPKTCVHGACRNGQCVCHAGYKGQTCSDSDRNIMPNRDVQVGINLAEVSYFSAELKFVDIFKQSMEWLTQRERNGAWDTHERDKITWRSDGYPARLDNGLRLITLVYRGFGSYEENGDYTILYDGEGEIDFKLSQHTIKHKSKGRMVVNFPNIGNGGIELILKQTNPSNPLHNIRFILPGYENTYDRFPFHPLFLEGIRRFSEYRYMDFMHTNGHVPEPTTWASRRKPDYHTQGGEAGGALEHMVELSNTMGASPWFCMPHAADDDYVRKFAQYVKTHLRSDLKIYVEYSNEVWNGIFRQTKYTQEKGSAMFPSEPKFRAGMKYYNVRSAQMANLWTQVFDGAKDRVVPVWSWQTGYRDFTKQALADLANRKSSFKAIAITGYFDCDQIADQHANAMKSMSMTDIQRYCNNDLHNMRDDFTFYMNLARTNGLKLVMYEGGPSIMENGAIVNGAHDQAVTDKTIECHDSDVVKTHAESELLLFYQGHEKLAGGLERPSRIIVEFNRNSAIEKPVKDVLDAWNSIVTQNSNNQFPGGLFNYFSYTKIPSEYGSWGMIEYTGQKMEDVPKFRAVADFIHRHYSTNAFGPHCSFVEGSHESYGCYRSSGGSPKFSCGKTTNHGSSWTTLQGLYPHDNDYVVLDGANFVTHKLFIRVVHWSYGTSLYYEYDTRTNTLKKMVNFYYYSDLYRAPTVPRLPDGYSKGLESHVHCNNPTTVVG